jgi:hypothetical protein
VLNSPRISDFSLKISDFELTEMAGGTHFQCVNHLFLLERGKLNTIIYPMNMVILHHILVSEKLTNCSKSHLYLVESVTYILVILSLKNSGFTSGSGNDARVSAHRWRQTTDRLHKLYKNQTFFPLP